MTQPGGDPRVAIQSRLEGASAYNCWIADQARPHLGSRVLDAGCGSGNVTRLLLDRDLVVAVDLWDEFVALMSERFGALDNVRVHLFDLADDRIVDALRPYRLDSAVCINVLEHIEDDRAALANLARLLPPGGGLFLLVPAFPALYGAMDRADHHVRRYTRQSLRDTVAPLPLEIEEARYMNMPGVVTWFVTGRVLRRRFVSERSYRLYDRFVPVIRRVEGRFSPPFGQSLVAVLRKLP